MHLSAFEQLRQLFGHDMQLPQLRNFYGSPSGDIGHSRPDIAVAPKSVRTIKTIMDTIAIFACLGP